MDLKKMKRETWWDSTGSGELCEERNLDDLGASQTTSIRQEVMEKEQRVKVSLASNPLGSGIYETFQ